MSQFPHDLPLVSPPHAGAADGALGTVQALLAPFGRLWAGNRVEIDQLHWWYWAATWCLLVAGLEGSTTALVGATGLAGVQVVHYRWLRGSFSAFAVQVRLAALGLFSLGFVVPGIFAFAALGLFLRCTVNYCAMARALKLLPWNRDEPLTWAYARRVFLQAPSNGPLVVASAPSR